MRRVLVDTNVIISALLFPNSTPAAALINVLSNERLVLAEWIIAELHEVISRKRPDLEVPLELFLAGIDYETALAIPSGEKIADKDDQPILDAAIASRVEVVLTGDRHFLDLDLASPAIMTPRAYLDSFPAAD